MTARRDRTLPRRFLALATLFLFSVAAVQAGEADAPRYPERWVYCSANLQVERSVKDVIALIGRAKADGYTTMLLADYKLQVLDRVPDHYFTNVEKVKAAAAKAGIELVPAVFPIGYSNGLLAHDPNLAEGLPVVDQPYIVRQVSAAGGSQGGGRLEAVLDARNPTRLRNGGLEKVQGDRFAGFTFQDDPGLTTHADRRVVHAGRVSCRLEPGVKSPKRETTNVRLMQRVAVRPMTAYRFSCWARTRDLGPARSFRLLALGAREPGRTLSFQEGLIEPNQDWKRIEVVFNSQDQKEVNLYAGIWGEGPGTLWIDDLQIDELPLVNVLRRPGCPVTIRSADGRTVYNEKTDFEPVVDPKLGAVPWGGEYEFDHPGARLVVRPASRLRPGDRILVSWYHPVITVGGQVMCCLSEPKVEEILRDQARRVEALFHPRSYFMSHDEIRVANWCKACQDRKKTPGALLADNVKLCTRIIESVNPRARVFVWSDMFDPHHNAVDSYYLVNGSLKGSWEGLPRQVVIANWNGGKARESLAFFDRRGHRQLIAGYYDVNDLSNFRSWDAAARDIGGVMGFMYTTWGNRYGLLEAYGKAIEAARRP